MITCRIFWGCLVRTMLMLHVIFITYKLQQQMNNLWYWWMCAPCVFQVLDGYKKAVHRKGEEDKWICACFFIYLISAVPSIWILELDRLNCYLDRDNQTTGGNASNPTDGSCTEGDLGVMNSWTLMVEQSLLLVVIFGRWLLPRGELTREELSQLLFVFIGMGSDIMELFDLFEEPIIRKDEFIKFSIFVVWTVSLMQFCLVLTATRDPNKNRVSVFRLSLGEQHGGTCKCLETELWSITLSFILQDGPFLAIRLYVILYLRIVKHTILFFAAKNIVLVLLIFYRIFVLCYGFVCCMEDNDRDVQLRTRKPLQTKGYSQDTT